MNNTNSAISINSKEVSFKVLIGKGSQFWHKNLVSSASPYDRIIYATLTLLSTATKWIPYHSLKGKGNRWCPLKSDSQGTVCLLFF
jgi:hypothetical protein